MINTLSIAIKPDLHPISKDVSYIVNEVETITFDLYKIIDDYNSIIELANKYRKLIDFQDFLVVVEWLYDWYKKIDDLILSGRILQSITSILWIAHREKENRK